jgi:hypothetical protein
MDSTLPIGSLDSSTVGTLQVFLELADVDHLSPTVWTQFGFLLQLRWRRLLLIDDRCIDQDQPTDVIVKVLY